MAYTIKRALCLRSSLEDIEACERAGITPYVSRPIRGPAFREDHFAKELFRYIRSVHTGC